MNGKVEINGFLPTDGVLLISETFTRAPNFEQRGNDK